MPDASASWFIPTLARPIATPAPVHKQPLSTAFDYRAGAEIFAKRPTAAR